MKKIISLLVFLTFLMSCTHIYFLESQPNNSTRLPAIPSELHGFWSDENGSTEIAAHGITIIEISEDTTSGEPQKISDTKFMELNENFQLYKSKDLYVFNLKETEGKYWEIGVVKRDSNGDIYYYTSSNYQDFTSDKRLKMVEAKYLDGDKERTFKKVQEDTDMVLEHAVYSGKMDHKTLLNITKEVNLVAIYRADGSIYKPI